MGTKTDKSGCTIFGDGEIGRLHVLAHRMLDRDRPRQGYQALAQALRHRRGEGSEWVHIQWHLLVFELAVGRWHDARRRFEQHLLSAVDAGAAVTDAPAALWRLRLAAPSQAHGRALPWDRVHAVAARELSKLGDGADSFVTLHHLLALAGRGDRDSLIRYCASPSAARMHPALRSCARALGNYAAGEYAAAAMAFAAALPQIAQLGGSHAQNGLFHALADDARARSGMRAALAPVAAA